MERWHVFPESLMIIEYNLSSDKADDFSMTQGLIEDIIDCNKKIRILVAGIFTSAGTKRDGKDCLKMLEVALGFHHGMKVVEGILRVDGESDKEIKKRCLGIWEEACKRD